MPSPKPSVPADAVLGKIEAALETELIGYHHTITRVSRDGKRTDTYVRNVSVKGWEVFAGLFVFGLWEVGQSIASTLNGLDPLNWAGEIQSYVGQLVNELEGNSPPAPPPSNLSMMGFIESKIVADWGNISALITNALGQAQDAAASGASSAEIPAPLVQVGQDLAAVPAAVASGVSSLGPDLSQIPAAVAQVPAAAASAAATVVAAAEQIPAETVSTVKTVTQAIRNFFSGL